MLKTCILFGAGAEIGLGISGGRNFALKVIGVGTGEMDNAIRTFYSYILKNCNHSEWFPKVVCSAFNEELLLKASVKKEILDNHREYTLKKEYDKCIEDRVKSLLNSPKEKEAVLDSYTSYMGIIDEKFHTLISPKALGPQKFWDVVFCYTRAYLLIVSEMMQKDSISEVEYQKILFDIDYVKQIISSFCTTKSKLNSYYSILRENSDANTSIITTNYTPLCQSITGIASHNIAAIHGQLGLFESPYQLRVYNGFERALPNELCFPYMFIQSGIKPIIEEYQLREYSKMLDFLKNSDRLVIVGYRINSDDNHINGIIKNYVDNKKIIYLDYDNGSTKEKICYRLRLDNYENLDYRHIDSQNAFSIFTDVLKSSI